MWRTRARVVLMPVRMPAALSLFRAVLRRMARLTDPVAGAGGVAVLAEHDITLPLDHVAGLSAPAQSARPGRRGRDDASGW